MERFLRSTAWVLAAWSLGLSACRREAPPPPPAPSIGTVSPSPHLNPERTRLSAIGTAVLKQTQLTPETCKSSCSLQSRTEEWSSDQCLGKPADFAFVSPDCDVVLVVVEYPRIVTTWQTTPVVLIFRRGQRIGEYMAGHLIRDASKLRQTGQAVRWLSGVLGVPGAAPRSTGDGVGVELTTIDGVRHTLEFNAPLPKPLVAATQQRVEDDGRMYQWTDEEGAVQFTQGLANVPAPFRANAKVVSGDGLSQMSGDPNLREAAARIRSYDAPVKAVASPRFQRTQIPFQRKEGYGPDGVYRNERGEDYIQASRRWAEEKWKREALKNFPRTFDPSRTQPLNPNGVPVVPKSCVMQGASCSRPTDCCTGSCSAGRCN